MSRTSTISRTLSLALALGTLSLGTLALNAAPAAAEDGIKSLITVTQMKADNANDEALERTATGQPQTGPLILEANTEPQNNANAESNRSQAEKRLADHRNETRRNWAP